MSTGLNVNFSKSVSRCKLPHGIFEPDQMLDSNLVTESDLDNCIDYFEQFGGKNTYYLGEGNYRNNVPIFGHGRS